MTTLSTPWKDRGRGGNYRPPAMLLLVLLMFGATPVAAFQDMFAVRTRIICILICILRTLL